MSIHSQHGLLNMVRGICAMRYGEGAQLVMAQPPEIDALVFTVSKGTRSAQISISGLEILKYDYMELSELIHARLDKHVDKELKEQANEDA